MSSYDSLTYLIPSIIIINQQLLDTSLAQFVKDKTSFLHEVHYKTNLPKLIELFDAVDYNPYHVYFYMISRFYYFDRGDNDIIFYYGVKERSSYFVEAVLAALPPRFRRETVRRDTHEYIEMPGCLWFADSFSEDWMCSYVANLFKHIWKDVAKEKGKFTYISRVRGFTKLRRVINEEELYRPLKDIGFSIYYLEDLTFEQQIKLFRSSEIITSMHGAGLSHMIFCEPRTLICEINGEHTPMKNHYRDVAIKCKHQYYRYLGVRPVEVGGHEDIEINVNGYIEALQHIKTLCVDNVVTLF